jgi:hypothetical protein
MRAHRDLPARSYRWQYGQRRAPLWRQSADGAYFRPWVSLLLEPSRGLTIARELHSQPKTADEVRAFILDAMAKPAEGVGGPCRPAQVAIDDPRLLQLLVEAFRPLQVKVTLEPDPGYLAAVLNQLEAAERGFRVAPVVTRIHLDLARELYRGALRFRHEHPVDSILAPQVFQLREARGREEKVLVVLGPEPCGVALFGSPEELARWMTGNSHQHEPRCWVQFAEASRLAFSDVEFLEAERLVVPTFADYPWVGHGSDPDCAGAEPRELKLLAFGLGQLPALLADMPTDERLLAGTGLFEDQQWFAKVLHLDTPSPIELTEPAPEDDLRVLTLDFLADQFLASLEGVSAATVKKHTKNIDILKRLHLAEAGPGSVESARQLLEGPTPYQEAFEQTVSPKPTAWTSYAATWRALQTYLQFTA